MRFCILLMALCLGSGPLLGQQPAAPATPAKLPAPLPPSATLLRWHFIGGQELAVAAKGTKLDVLRAGAASAEFRKELTAKLVNALGNYLARSNAPAKDVTARQLEPLVSNLFDAQSVFELRGAPGQPVSWNLAIKLNKEHAGIWQANLAKLAARGTRPPATLKVGDFTGWSSVDEDGLMTHCLTAGDWIVYGRGSEVAPMMAWLEQIKSKAAPAALPAGQWLTVDANLAALAERLQLGAPVPLPQVSLKVSGKDEYVRSEAVLRFEQPLAMRLDAWRIPTNTIHDPLVSFTAVRGVESFVQKLHWWPALEIAKAPNQLYIWSQSPVPFHTSLAAPIKGASNEVRRLTAKAPQFIKQFLGEGYIGELRYDTNRGSLFWHGMPVIIPFIQAAPEPGGDFVQAGFFPLLEKETTPVPAPLLAQVQARTNLVYYNWEITGQRLKQWHPILQALSIASPTPDINMGAAQNWLMTMAPELGNSITEITQSSPQQLMLTRRSHVGLTGFELVMLSRWLDNPGFPHFGKKPGTSVPRLPPSP